MRARWLVFASLLGGCYLSHGRPEPDAHVPLARDDASVQIDAGRDAGPIDAGAPACTLVRSGEVVVRQPLTHSAQAPDVAFTGSELAVAMMEGGGDLAHPLVTLATVTPDLSRVSDAITIGEEAHGWGEIDWAGGALSLCWHGDPGGPGRTMIRRVFEGGARLGPRRDHDRAGESCLDLVAAGERALIAWRHRVEVEGGFAIETRVQAITLDGEPISDPITLASSAYPGRSIDLFATDDAFFAALSPSEGVVRVIELTHDGWLRAERELLVPDARGATIAAAHERVALLIAIGPADVRSLGVMVLDGALAPRGELRVVSDGAPTTISASIEPAPDGWIIAWADGHQPSNAMTLLHLDRDGWAREPRVRAHRGSNSGYGGPAMVRVEDDVYVALSRSEASHEGVALQRWRCEPSAPDPCRAQDVADDECDTDEPAAWRWNGSSCVSVSCPSACRGPECDRLAPSRFACLADHAQCMLGTECEGTLARTPIDAACGVAAVREDEPMRVMVTRTLDCHCGATLACVAHVDAPFSILLETSICHLPAVCDCVPGAGATLGASCELPPLSAGVWTVRGDLVGALTLRVHPAWETPERTPVCTE